tara:strand:+ start:49 stop:192 length:144 start_codon:yes stop_codon:yes gene_type:complete
MSLVLKKTKGNRIAKYSQYVVEDSCNMVECSIVYFTKKIIYQPLIKK